MILQSCDAFGAESDPSYILEKRKQEAARITEKFPDKVPVVLEKDERSDIADIVQKNVQSLQNLFLTCDSISGFKRFVIVMIGDEDGELVVRYLVSADITVGQFVHIIRNGINVGPEKAIFIFVNNTLPSNASLMKIVHEENKDEDGFLYMTYSGENTFGSF
ncbi:hypothetical protein FEM48_Zijuj01G0125400 [Ziziphus jujuba var. spinosa]|uniref:Autophagy-related protein n=1 Tax=Ziziphus jujuba var. spinosa TaxID=714518 RepID=A0A978W1A3_ZIZJJ|nr:hypothetical protein FEM48_Zijuj01G0125400 [Ziziphus jujuba var. spinosa]